MEPTIYKVSGIWVGISVAFWLAVGAFASFTVVVPLIAFVMIVRATLLYFSTEVTLDEGGASLKRGILTKEDKRLPIGNIHAVSTAVGPIAGQFDYGTVALAVGNDRSDIKDRQLGWVSGSQAANGTETCQVITL